MKILKRNVNLIKTFVVEYENEIYQKSQSYFDNKLEYSMWVTTFNGEQPKYLVSDDLKNVLESELKRTIRKEKLEKL